MCHFILPGFFKWKVLCSTKGFSILSSVTVLLNRIFILTLEKGVHPQRVHQENFILGPAETCIPGWTCIPTSQPAAQRHKKQVLEMGCWCDVHHDASPMVRDEHTEATTLPFAESYKIYEFMMPKILKIASFFTLRCSVSFRIVHSASW